MTIEAWLPGLVGYLIPVGLFLLAWGGMEPSRARQSTTVGALALAVGTLGYFTVGFIAISAGAPFFPPWAALLIGIVAGLLLPLGVFLVEQVLRLPDATATIALGITAGIWGLLAVAVFADGRSGQGWNGVGLTEYHTVPGQGVTGFLPAKGFIADGRGQLIAQLAGLGAIAIPAWLISWLTFFAFSLPYRRVGPKNKRRGIRWLAPLKEDLTSQQEAEAEPAFFIGICSSPPLGGTRGGVWKEWRLLPLTRPERHDVRLLCATGDIARGLYASHVNAYQLCLERESCGGPID